jgi:hypothetical protein
MHDISSQLQALIAMVLDLRRWLRKVADQAARAEQNVQFAMGTGGAGSGGAASFYYMPSGAVISAGGNLTGQSVYTYGGGGSSLYSSTATVYNLMGSATVSGTVLVLGINPDGTFSVVSQSCT